ncbi:MAG: AAA family ATPase [Candidatus Schekmanbacteria bacterium]|nr:AAA family ATPase [Candidatus Schekmanbacteria bacterium]
MILKQLVIQRFRGMMDVVLDDLAPITLVVGANNAGKSSVLEAASLLLRPLDPAQWVQVARQRDMDMPLADGLWSLFPSGVPLDLDDGPKQSRALRLTGQVALASRDLQASGLATLSWDAEESGDVTLRIEARINRQTVHDMVFRREAPAAYGRDVESYRCFTVTPATHRSTRALLEHLSKVVDEGRKQLAVDLLQLFDPEVQGLDVSAVRGRDGVRVTHASRGVVDLASFGDGMRRSAALALALTRASGGLLLIDELEAGIHPRILPRVMTRLVEGAAEADVQILASTHSLEACDAMMEATREQVVDAAAYYLGLGPDHGHELRRYGKERIIEMREAGLDLR